MLAAAGGLVTGAAVGRSAFATPAAADPASRKGYVDVQVVSITDLHGYLQPPAPTDGGLITGAGGVTLQVGGVGYLAAQLKRLREGRVNSIFCSAGDNFSGWPYYVDSQNNEPTIEALNAMGLQFSSVGNHELDKGPEFLIKHMEHGVPYPAVGIDDSFIDSTGARFHGADFRYYSGNVLYKDSGKAIVPPYNVEWVTAPNGRRWPIGFIHLTVFGAEGADPTLGFNCSFQPTLTTMDEIETANRYAAELKRRNVNALAIVMHEGGYAGTDYNSGTSPTGPCFDIAHAVSPDIGAIITGHWHCRFNMMVPDPNGLPRPVVEAGYYGQVINEIQLALDPDTGEIVRELTLSTNHAVTHDLPVDEELQDIADYWTGQSDKLYATALARQTGDFTRIPNPDGESTLGNLVADFMVWDTLQSKQGHAELALCPAHPIVGAAALRGDLPYAKGTNPMDEDGLILFGEAWTAYGYDSPVVSVSITGDTLHQALEQQWQTQPDGSVKYGPLAVSAGVSYRYDTSKPVGQRVAPSDVTINGKPLDLGRRYRVAANSYTIEGRDGFPALMAFTDPVRHSLDHEGFIRYVRERRVLSPAPLGRAGSLTAVPAFAGPPYLPDQLPSDALSGPAIAPGQRC
ncbi:5'-nucleotidase [Rugosimonospora africana]|uniref:5'-nucleotidase n=1 Tax=Rugosimonospora africana TaxID=556532 RepID=A0A8J3VSH4_9ACTN|nr:5'-nucleotidase [Rugosimonospora africana]